MEILPEYQQKVIQKAKTKGFKGNDIELAVEFILSNFKQFRYNLLIADWFDISNNTGNMQHTLPIFGTYLETGEFWYNNKLKRFESEAIDCDGSLYLLVSN